VTCSCNIVGLLATSMRGVFSASIDGSTTVEVAEDGTVLLGQTTSTLSIGAYAFLPGENRYLNASCPLQAQANIPWETREDCDTGDVFFIPKGGAKASITNRVASGVDLTKIDLSCNPGVGGNSFSASAASGPVSPFFFATREDGFNLVYNGNPIAVETGKPQRYTIGLGFVGTIEAYLQSFSLTVNPPDVARVQYSFVFSGVAV